jgi:hypothetical protein
MGGVVRREADLSAYLLTIKIDELLNYYVPYGIKSRK